LPTLDTLQKMPNSLLVNVDIPIDTTVRTATPLQNSTIPSRIGGIAGKTHN